MGRRTTFDRRSLHGIARGLDIRVLVVVIGPPTVCYLPFVAVAVLGSLRDGGMWVVVVPQLPLKLVFVHGLCPDDLVQALLGEGTDIS